jgi:REP element-mobilizing transposase RayT
MKLAMSTCDPEKHHRRSIRLREYDYSRQGAYFLTLCTWERKCIFGRIQQDDIVLSPWGEIVKEEWAASSQIRKEIRLGEYVIMPNHIHGIVAIIKPEADGYRPDKLLGSSTQTIGAMMAGFKATVTRRINRIRDSPGAMVWQRYYYEHIIRDGEDYRRITEYIAQNPMAWHQDSLHPDYSNIENSRILQGMEIGLAKLPGMA